MGTILLTLAFGVLNLSLGYALAIHMSRATIGPSSATLLGSVRVGGPSIAVQPIQTEPPAATRKDLTAEGVGRAPDEVLCAGDPMAAKEETSRQRAAEVDPIDGEGSADLPLDERYVETSVLKLNLTMMRSAGRATRVDARLRSCQGGPDLETIRQCVSAIKEDCATYLAEQSEAAAELHERLGAMGELAAVGEAIETAHLQQAAQIETTLSNLDHMDLESDPEAAGERLLEEIGRLREAQHKLRDYQETAFVAIARAEDRIGTVEERLGRDALTGLPNRIGLEKTVWRWWQEGRHRSQPMVGALVDVDRFGRVNAEHGPLVGNRVLHHLAGYITKFAGESDLVGRFAGQRFLWLMQATGSRNAIKNVELLRQTIEKARFTQGGQVIQLTAACAISDVLADDRPETLFGRLEETLQELKQQGPNQSFFHDGQAATPIRSPSLKVEASEIVL